MSLVHRLNYYFISDISPKLAISLSYFEVFKKKMNYKNPVTLNEKINCLKLTDYMNDEIICQCADKLLVREYVEKKLKSTDILNEIYGYWERAEDIDWNILPSKFVLKVNHGAGFNIVCKDKKSLDKESTIKKLNEWINREFWKVAAETQYKNIPKRIIAEKFIETESGDAPNDYKFYCFHGEVNCMMSCEERGTGNTKFYYFDKNGKLIPYSKDSIDAIKNNKEIILPSNYSKMIEIATILSNSFKFVRVDLYSEFNKIIFGELTFTPGAGLDSDRLKEVDIAFGSLLNI